MNFSQQPYVPGETIAAVATPPGEGGVAIIRISGKQAVAVADKVFSQPVASFDSHTVHYGRVVDDSGLPVDDVLLIPMLGKRSFTGEDTIEIHCHGGTLITRRVLDVILRNGARQALPGEFSFKAFMNGKIDLSQAEAIQELICAKNERALDAAEGQLQGKLSQKIQSFQKQLTDIAAILEAWVDFPEEGLEFASVEEVIKKLELASEQMKTLLDTFHDGRIIHDGLALCLVGAPNVGKSSLMNALLDKERAIVSTTPGTTRDIVEDHMRLNGLNLRLIDTAGIRETSEEIEEEGIRRSHQAMRDADLILLVLESNRLPTPTEKELLASVPKEKTIVVFNKIDLPQTNLIPLDDYFCAKVSAKDRIGLDELQQLIDRVVWDHGVPSKEEVLITNVRHKEALQDAYESCNQLISGLQSQMSPEFLTMDMRHCLHSLGKIIGTDVSEEILTSIFSNFCIGK
ncbi:MAG: tRNA uridine-5-carboxymethylaminomethyl(34) synthesis GTPase MnmE [Chlamydiota bacterium]